MAQTTSPDNISYPTVGDRISPLATWFANIANTTQAAITKLRGELTTSQQPVAITLSQLGATQPGWTNNTFACYRVGKVVMLQASFTKSTNIIHGDTPFRLNAAYMPNAPGMPSYPLPVVLSPGGTGVGGGINSARYLNCVGISGAKTNYEVSGMWIIA